MGEEHESGLPDSRAPWERPIADSGYRSSHSGRVRRRPEGLAPPADAGPAPSGRGADTGRPRRSAAPDENPDQVTVAALMNKVGRDSPPGRHPEPEPAVPGPQPGRPRRTPAVDDDPTEKIPPVAAAPPTGPPPPPPRDDRAGRRSDDPDQPPALPQAVGGDGLSRLALNKRRKRRRLATVGRTVLALLSVLTLVGSGLVWGYVRSTEAGFAQIAALDTESTDIVDPGGQTGDETYLIIGTDTRAGASGAVGAGTVADAEGARADTVILVNIPADRSRVVAVSFPRDLDVTRPVCRGWDSTTGEYTSETFPAAEGDKLNATYALGGPKCLVKVIQKLSGLKIGHFVGIDFAGFESMVNEVGGVEVCTPTPLVDGELGTIIETAGTHTLDGRRALDYVRARKVESEGNGDYGRITRQQKFLSSLLRSAMSNKVLFDPGKLNGFISAFTRATFVENVDTESLVRLGRSLQRVEAGAVTFLTVPTAGTNEWGNEIPRLDDIKAIFNAIIDDEPLPGEKRDVPEPESSAPPAAPLPAQTAVDPSTVSVQVSNASGESGLAARTAEELGAYGFPIYSVGNYSGTSKETVVRFSPGLEAEALTLASAVPGAVLQESQDLGGIVELVLGTGFVGSIAAPTEVGSVLPTVPIQAAEENELPVDLSITNAGDDSCA
ncbi:MULTISPECIES: LCP family protein [unclassified Rhodococcus (in: high G+C Gram-positive bacteria)]|uniref:LCP family protein n=1 Tax=unclassified Rhodococcus (in: high G+C Gram-positive bacteria) TaxID=192944 RepID=UPI00092A1F43|nr:LCP family protein [Rhodococcus sp. M8]OLL20810.1 LytR family transcriptional regulator [Rhodococcus sp. M8]QPG44655.1 LCP family protein [Rhodococcus sp. M8]